MRLVAAALFSPFELSICSISSGMSSRVGGLLGVAVGCRVVLDSRFVLARIENAASIDQRESS